MKRILCCVKLVPEKTAWDEGKNVVSRDGSLVINAADRGALRKALEIKKAEGAELVVLSMGPAAGEDTLQDLFLYGADRVILVCEEAFRGSDTLSTARILDRCVEQLGAFDLILTGMRSSDGETGHVGAELAVLHGLGCVSSVTELTVEYGTVICKRLLEDAVETLRIQLPCVLTVRGGHELPPPSLADMRLAKKKTVERLDNRVLDLPEETVGIIGSPTVVERTIPVPQPRAHCRFLSAQEAVEILLQAKNRPQGKRSGGRKEQECLAKSAMVISLRRDAATERTAGELLGKAKELFETVSFLQVDTASRDEVRIAQAIAEEIRAQHPYAVLFPATVRGRNLAPMCAAMLGAGLTADCTELHAKEGRLYMVRPAFSGTLLAEIVCRGELCMASVRPGIFSTGELPGNPKTLFLKDEGQVTLLGRETSHNVPPGDAEWILSGGKGIGSRAAFERLEAIGKRLGAGVCASRSAVDSGYAPYFRQVGQTGAAVSPRIYVALGISGAVQHMAGIRGGTLLAVNHDPKAPIFQYADFGVISSWETFVEALINSLEQQKGEDP